MMTGAIASGGCAGDERPLQTLAAAMSSSQLLLTPCDPGPVALEPSLVYDDLDRLGTHFQLREVLDQLIDMADVTVNANADALWDQWWRSNLPHDPAAPVAEPRCGDGDGAERNGFPLDCDRPETVLATDEFGIETHQPVQLVNRFDLMPLDGAHCGEYRIVYGMKDSDLDGDGEIDVVAPNGKNLLIFEGVVDNPDPGCGAAGCRPIVDFWAGLTSLDEDERITELRRFYFEGLVEHGVDPVIRPEAYGLNEGSGGYLEGHGQIRTNQFVDFQAWTLREYALDRVCKTQILTPTKPVALTGKKKPAKKKSAKKRPIKISLASSDAHPKTPAITKCKLIFRPRPVGGNPFPGLFTADDALSLAFRAGPDDPDSFLSQLGAMIPTQPTADGSWPIETINSISMAPAGHYNAAESLEQPSPTGGPLNQYDILPGSPFEAAVAAELPPTGPYTTQQIANRATAASCAGCHRLSGAFDRSDLGNGVSWDSIFFTHVDDLGGRSAIMQNEFLPHRLSVMLEYLDTTCDACLDEPLLRLTNGELVTDEDLDPQVPDEGMGGVASPPSEPPDLAKDVVHLGGKATLGGSQTH